MNVKTTAEIQSLNSTDLRAYAKEIGAKRSASDTKATLLAKVLDRAALLAPAPAKAKAKAEAENLERQEIAAMKAKAKTRIAVETAARKAPAKAKAKNNPPSLTQTRRAKGKKVCTEAGCERRQSTQVLGPELCDIHLEEADWENTHNDYAHEGNTAESEQAEIKKCWICHPELNKAREDYVPRKGHSKLGMRVIAKGDKIAVTRAGLESIGGIVKTQTDKKTGFTGLVARVETEAGVFDVECGWFGQTWYYPTAMLNGKKFRNVSELFRILGINPA